DDLVTGVQTCALPISAQGAGFCIRLSAVRLCFGLSAGLAGVRRALCRRRLARPVHGRPAARPAPRSLYLSESTGVPGVPASEKRSEERRVGKGCSTEW